MKQESDPKKARPGKKTADAVAKPRDTPQPTDWVRWLREHRLPPGMVLPEPEAVNHELLGVADDGLHGWRSFPRPVFFSSLSGTRRVKRQPVWVDWCHDRDQAPGVLLDELIAFAQHPVDEGSSFRA